MKTIKLILKLLSWTMMYAAFVVVLQGFVILVMSASMKLVSLTNKGISKIKMKKTLNRTHKIETYKGNERIFH